MVSGSRPLLYNAVNGAQDTYTPMLQDVGNVLDIHLPMSGAALFYIFFVLTFACLGVDEFCPHACLHTNPRCPKFVVRLDRERITGIGRTFNQAISKCT